MSVAQDTAAQLVQNIFDLQRALRGVTASGTKHSDLGAPCVPRHWRASSASARQP
jgi:hypothetical protein